ncbi:EAL domain-containing protein [Microbacteriaceae bacterium 4G12]
MTTRSNKCISFLIFFIIFYTVWHYIWFYYWKDSIWMNNLGTDIASFVANAIASYFLLYSFRKSKEKTRHFWLILCIGSVSYSIGNIIWYYKEIVLAQQVPEVSISDVFYLLFVLLYIVAFSYKIMYEHDMLYKLFIICDIAITASVVITLDYYFIIQNIVYDCDFTIFSKYVQVAYPIGALILLIISISLYFRPVSFTSKKVLYLLIFTLTTYAVFDSIYDYIRLFSPKIFLDTLEPAYQITFLLTALAGVFNTQNKNPVSQQIFSIEVEGKIRSYLPYIGTVILSILTLSVQHCSNILTVGLCSTFAFVLIRQILIRQQNQRLLTQLKQFNKDLEDRIELRTSDLVWQKDALFQSKQRFQSLYDHHPDPIFTLTLHGRFLNVNKAGTQMLGYEAKELLNKLYTSLVYEDDLPKIKETLDKATLKMSQALEVRAYHKNRDLYDVSVTVVPIVLKNKVKGAYVIVKDITEVKRQQEQINYLAYHDTLTGLCNRSCFTKKLEQAIEQAKITNEKIAVMFVDLDRFKVINDTLGHNTGDLVLKEVAQRLKKTIASQAGIARLGGDEFTILMRNYQDYTDVEKIAKSVLDAFQAPIEIDGHTLHVTPSIGISIYPDCGEDIISLLKQADVAMYNIKNNGKNNFTIYNENMNQQVQRKLRLEKDLYQALQKEELFLLYQPQIAIQTQQVIGMEALIRWQHPQLGVISPYEFIPIAEETNLVIPIGEWVLREACKQMKQWERMGYTHMKIGVNLSAAEFRQENFIDIVTSALKEIDLHPSYLDLELTERMAMMNEKETLTKLKQLKDLGIHTSIDDFGTGYSSLAYLSLYPINTLKIAREFITMAENSEEGKAIISTILSMSQALKMSVIAEGVETREQLEFLLREGCPQVQGYYFSKPLNKDDSTKFLEGFPFDVHKEEPLT